MEVVKCLHLYIGARCRRIRVWVLQETDVHASGGHTCRVLTGTGIKPPVFRPGRPQSESALLTLQGGACIPCDEPDARPAVWCHRLSLASRAVVALDQ